MSQKRYFGTDGIRGEVGSGQITAEFFLKLGRAAGTVLADTHSRMVVIGKDTRISGYMFESVLEAGLVAAGCDVRLLGPIPTPAVAYLTKSLRASAGIVISASHNPHSDNGIKFFSAAGEKLPDDIELAIEAEIEAPFTTVPSDHLGKAKRIDDAKGRYAEFLKSSVGDVRLDGLHIVLDCAHGAAYQVGPQVFEELGAKLTTLGTAPDGTNINRGCGSTQLAALKNAVTEHHADLGIALDGDADRVLMVDRSGNTVDGDELLYILARDRQIRGTLKGGVVGTVMTNVAIEKAYQHHGIEFVRAKVGDRYVHQLLKQHGWDIGGEGSGHIILRDKATTGDGLLSALAIVSGLVQRGDNADGCPGWC